MISLLEKMGTAINSLEGDIGQMNDFLKHISLEQTSEELDQKDGLLVDTLGEAAELS